MTAVIPCAVGRPAKTFDFPPAANVFAGVAWTADGRALTYIDNRGGVSNIWRQPLDGGPPKQLTAFKTDQILDFARSRNGQQLAVGRGTETSDVGLISNSR